MNTYHAPYTVLNAAETQINKIISIFKAQTDEGAGQVSKQI